MNATPKFPSVLFLDNHISHLSIEAVAKARKKGVHINTFPPKRSHQMQPLGIAIYGPFKRYYASFCNACLTSHPRSTISSYEIAEISENAYESAVTVKNITAGFKTTGIYPFNPTCFWKMNFWCLCNEKRCWRAWPWHITCESGCFNIITSTPNLLWWWDQFIWKYPTI